MQTLNMDDVAVHCSIMEAPDPAFNRQDQANEHMVFIRVKAFSLNYRDKNRIFSVTVKAPAGSYYIVGSEFCGEVVDVGSKVTGVRAGDRVIGNNAYPDSGWPGVAPGVPSNHASREYQTLHESKLIKIPDEMTDEIGAAFSIGAQTTYSMVRRLELQAGAAVLVTAAKSNTSLFAINALHNFPVEIYAVSTSSLFEAELLNLGVRQLFVIDRNTRFDAHSGMCGVVMARGGFQAVIDPYFDLYLRPSISVMGIGARYITCGLYDQYLGLIGKPVPAAPSGGGELMSMMLRNLSVIGNCIGTINDLSNAIADFKSQRLPVMLDSVYSDGRAADFLDRTYNARNRFGKVVYKY
jgi:NADPH:quinone reductase-like Zn-dependent oxidoreductase